MSLEDIVSINITRETTNVSRTAFNTLMFLGLHKVFTDRIKYYSSLKEVSDDGFLITSNEYLAAQSFFSQSPHPKRIAIGRRQADNGVVTVSTVTNSFQYQITINSTTISYTSDGTATTNEITAGLTSAINASGVASIVTATDGMDGTVTIAPDVAGTAFKLLVPTTSQSKLTVAPGTASETLTACLNAIRTIDDTWYALSTYDKVQADIVELAGYVETIKKIYGVSVSEAGVLDNASTTDTAYVIKAASYYRTFVMYSAQAATKFPEVAFFGRYLVNEPGTATAKFKSLSGITPDVLSTTQETNAVTKNAMVYETIGGQAMTLEGKVAGGEYIDVIIGIDWLQSRMTERIFGVLVNAPKIPYTDAGIAVIEGEIRAQLDDAVKRNVLSADVPYSVSVPKSSEVSSGDKAARVLNDVSFSATLAGAIHAVNVVGNVSL